MEEVVSAATQETSGNQGESFQRARCAMGYSVHDVVEEFVGKGYERHAMDRSR